MASFAQRLTLLREKNDLKKKDLAKILNVSAACISQYEKGVSMPGHDILTRIAQHFDVSVDFLLANDSRGDSFDLSQPFTKETTYIDLLNVCRQIPAKKRAALLAVADALKQSTDN